MNHHLAPNWSSGVKETYEFKTTVFTTESGKEQRSAERLTPRRSVSFNGVAFGDNMRSLQGLMHDRGAAEIFIPDAARYGAVLIEDAPEGATSIWVNHYPLWWEDGAPVAISTSWESEFLSMGGYLVDGHPGPDLGGAFDEAYSGAFNIGERFTDEDQPTNLVVSPLTRAWAAGSVLRPAIGGRLRQQFSATFPTNSVMRYNADLALTAPSPLQRLTNLHSLPLVKNLPVLNIAPNWANPPTAQFNTPFDEVDYGRGVSRHFLPIDFFTRISQFTYSGRSRSDVARVLRLFCYMRGRQGEFYCPTWSEDVIPVSGFTAGAPTLTVNYDAQRYRTSTVNRAIMIKLNDGTTFYRHITAMQAVSEGGAAASQLTLDEDFPVSASRDDIAMISWLNRSRFATDSMTIEWLTDDVMRIVAQIMTVEDLD